MKIAIIGAGPAGLVALKYSLSENHDCVVYEKSGIIGGNWNYSDNIGLDEFGLPVHSSMYYGLTTNIPKELMQFEDFPHKELKRSFLFQEEVLTYIKEYANTFHLHPYIKFFKHVIEVEPTSENKWTVKIQDLKTKIVEIKEYDAIMICVGNYSVPRIPKIEGDDRFKGKVIHSHVYRRKEPFKDRRVLVIGCGPSGLDISRIVAKEAKKVYISVSCQNHPPNSYSSKVVIKPPVLKFTENSVVFEDNSEETIDDIIYCTGFLYSYPFLSPKCDIEIENNWVKYLYKQVININHPTMAYIGLQFRTTFFPLFCLQAKFFLEYLKGSIKITRTEMLEDLNQYMQKMKEKGEPTHHAHFLGSQQGLYLDDLAETAKIKKIPPVIHKLLAHFFASGNKKFKMSYKILNDNEFEETPLETDE